jgi:hypothetical protein
VPLLLLLLALPVILMALMPLMLVLRYRAGTARRLARRWVATASLAATAISVALFLFGTAFTTFWVPNAFSAAACLGCLDWRSRDGNQRCGPCTTRRIAGWFLRSR